MEDLTLKIKEAIIQKENIDELVWMIKDALIHQKERALGMANEALDLLKLIDSLRGSVPSIAFGCKLGGSVALALQGLSLPRPLHDVDVIIAKDQFRALHRFVSNTILFRLCPGYSVGVHSQFSFQVAGSDLIFNILEGNPDMYKMVSDNKGLIKVEPVERILEIKEQYGRLKDIEDIKFCKLFLDTE